MCNRKQACCGRSSGADGFALLIVLGFLLLLSFFLVPFAGSARLRALVADNDYQDVRLGYAAEAIGALSAIRFAQEKRASGIPQPVAPSRTRCRLGHAELTIDIQDHSGLIGLNIASPELLQLGFASAGLVSSDASDAARSVVLYRSANGRDSSMASTGFEGYKYAPYEDVAELQELPLLRQVPVDRLMRIFTIEAKNQMISQRALAPPIKAIASMKSNIAAQKFILAEMAGSNVISVEVAIRNSGAYAYRGGVYEVVKGSAYVERLAGFPDDSHPSSMDSGVASGSCAGIFDAASLALLEGAL
jgi:general secretion pathway protein K